eukprot:UN16027
MKVGSVGERKAFEEWFLDIMLPLTQIAKKEVQEIKKVKWDVKSGVLRKIEEAVIMSTQERIDYAPRLFFNPLCITKEIFYKSLRAIPNVLKRYKYLHRLQDSHSALWMLEKT